MDIQKSTKMKIWFDSTSNAMKSPQVKKQIEANLKKDFEKEFPGIIKRMEKVPSFITTEIGFYSKLLDEAKYCYGFGLYHATVSMVGITAERFAIELSEKMNFKINQNEISEKDLFGKLLNQSSRLTLLEKAEIIKPEIYKKLKKISEIRNKYVHPREEGDAKKDSLRVIKLFIDVINSRFSDQYIIKNGKIVKKNS